MASYSPTYFYASFIKIIGPSLMIDCTTKIEMTTTNTVQKDKQN